MDTRKILSYQSDFLNCDDLQGHAAAVKITQVELSELPKPGAPAEKHARVILHFDGKRKKLVLSKTRLKQIQELYGYESDSWYGQTIRLAPGKATNGRETVDILPPQIEGVKNGA